MAQKIKLKNAPGKAAILDDKGYKAVSTDKHLKSLQFTDNLRAHSAGYPIYQRSITTKKGPEYETIYLHRWLADKFLKKPKSNKRLFLRFKNRNVLDCRIDNLEFVTMSDLRLKGGNATKKAAKKAAKPAKAAKKVAKPAKAAKKTAKPAKKKKK